MWTKIKQLTTDNHKVITWGLMPLVILICIVVGTQMYKLSTLDITEAEHRHGTIQSFEKDFNGYRERLRYKIKLKNVNQAFYIKNVMADKVENLDLVSKDKDSDIYFITDKEENTIIAMKVDAVDILTISKFNDHYKNMMIIDFTGATIFLVWFGLRVFRRPSVSSPKT